MHADGSCSHLLVKSQDDFGAWTSDFIGELGIRKVKA
jgi:hypothetical protein